MLSIISYIIVMFGCVNWLSIGFFQYDIVAGLFGYQGSIFSRIVYIIVGICAIYLTYSVIKHKGKISVKRLVKEEKLKEAQTNNDNNSSNNEQTNNNNIGNNQINNNQNNTNSNVSKENKSTTDNMNNQTNN